MPAEVSGPAGGRLAAASAARRWTLCLFLLAATTLNYLDRQTLSVLAPLIQRDMHLDNEALGWVFSAFYYAYTLAQFGVGAILDRTHLRWSYSLAVVAWSLAAALTGLSRSFAALLCFRILLGLAESANWPAAMRIVARVLPPQDRALGNGIFTSGTSLGALIAPALSLGTASWLGWRLAFPAVGSLGLAWFLAWVWFTSHAGFARVWRGSQPTVAAAGAYREILATGQFWRVFAITILVNPCLYFAVNWLPTYFVQERHLEPGRFLGGILTMIYLGLDADYLTCGFAVRRLSKRYGSRAARRVVFLAASVLLLLTGAIPWLASTTAAAAALVLVNLGAGMWIAMY
ncbi:MAG: MFS transporter, partial [Bryobacteraceae bacterium]